MEPRTVGGDLHLRWGSVVIDVMKDRGLRGGECCEMRTRHWVMAASGLLLALLSLWRLGMAVSGLRITIVRSTDPTLHILSSEGAAAGERPLVHYNLLTISRVLPTVPRMCNGGRW